MKLDDLGERLLSDMPDGLVVADASGTIRFWNDGAERIFGFAPAEACGQSLDIIVPEKLRARHWSGFKRTVQTGRSRYGAGDLLSVPAVRKDRQRISIQFSILPLPDSEGGLRGIAAIIRDVTAEFESRKALKRQLDAATEQSR